jgi:SAM-dependent methyltransferase
MKQSFKYSQNFYLSVDDRASATATEVFKVLSVYLRTESILDVGCGSGAWLEAGLKSGIKRATGVDLGSSIKVVENNPNLKPNIANHTLKLIVRDFVEDSTAGFIKSDLAMSLEVVEHLPEHVGRNLIQRLTESADFIVFSGAQPGQGGTYHINEQPLRYWVEEFKKYGFDVYDPFRSVLQNQSHHPRFYALNTLLFINQNAIESSKLVINPEQLQACRVEDLRELDKRTCTEIIRYWIVSLLPQKFVTFLSRRLKY